MNTVRTLRLTHLLAMGPRFFCTMMSGVLLTNILEVRPSQALPSQALPSPVQSSPVQSSPVATTESEVSVATISPMVSQPEVDPTIGMEQITTVAQLQTDEGSAMALTSMEQVTSVSQLSDVRPTDWAFQALQSLVERYGCIVGYPDRTFRGSRALTRYEFAAGLNACMDRVNELIAAATNDLAKQEDLKTLQKLQEEFAIELASLRGRVDSLEGKVAQLEKQQFSTTTKLSGITIVGVQGRLPNRADQRPRDGIKETQDPGDNVNLINWNYLILSTAFSPTSILTTSLLNVNGSGDPKITNDGRVAYDYGPVPGVQIGDLNYRFMVGDKFAAYVGTVGVYTETAFRGPNRAESAATGPVSFFAQRNPLLNMGFGAGGAGFDWQFAKRASVQAVFHTNVPGFFPSSSGPKGYNTLGVQLALTPIDPLDISIYYLNSYSPNGSPLFFVGDDALVAPDAAGAARPIQTNAVGTTVNWQVSRGLNLGGWFGYTNSRIPDEDGRVETTNYMLYANFPDLFGKGNMGGIYVGQPPKITNSNLAVGRNYPDYLNTGLGRPGGQSGTSTHVELFYRWQMTDNISITPGVFAVFQPGHSRSSEPVVVGALRTTLTW
jgi:hypothetical protein